MGTRFAPLLVPILGRPGANTFGDLMRRSIVQTVSTLILLSLVPGWRPAAEGEQFPEPEAESRFAEVARRYWRILEQRPRFGTAFDQWYHHYLDAGKLDQLIGRVEQAARDNPDDAGAQLLFGLVLDRRGRTQKADKAYKRAAGSAPGNFYPPYVRGRLLAREGRYEAAAAALKRAVNLDPPKQDRLDASQRLARVHLRLGNRQQALQAFERLAQTFPDDRRVLEQAAELLADEELYGEAIARWKQIAALSENNSHQRVQAQLKIADLEARRGRPAAAVKRLERTLKEVRPQSWLASEIRRRIEQAFRDGKGLAGFIDWAGQWLKQRPDDLAMAVHLADVLADSGRRADAIGRYRTVLEQAPSHRKARQALIDELTAAGRFTAAGEECRKLVEQHPSDVDALRLLGELQLRAAATDERRQAERKAVAIWKRIAEVRPDDPTLAVKVAEICYAAFQTSHGRGGDRADSAIFSAETLDSPLVRTAERFYREAVRRSGGKPRYYEFLGEFLHETGRREEAVSAWAKLAEPPRDTAGNRHRLAEVYSLFGYPHKAVAAGREAIARRPDDFRWRDFLIDLLLDADEPDAALEQLAHLDRLAKTPRQQKQAVDRRVEVYSQAERPELEIERLRRSLQDGTGSVADYWTLGLLLSGRSRLEEADESFQSALALEPENPPLIADYARLLVQKGDAAAAVKRYRRLAEIEPERRSAQYQAILRLEKRLDRPEQARQAAEQLVRAAPLNPEAYRLRAEVAFDANRVDEGLKHLRRAVTLRPHDLKLRTRLAATLAKYGRRNAAREHYWRCFELAESLPEKLSIVQALADLADDAAAQEALTGRLKRLRHEDGDEKALALCLAEVQMRTGHHAAARRALSGLLARHPDDVDVLSRLASVCEAAGDWPAAIAYQEKVVALDRDWGHIATWARYYTEMNRDKWLAEARRKKEKLFRKWAETFREYRELTGTAEKRQKHRKRFEALRKELKQLSWARDKFHRKERFLTGKYRKQSRAFAVWRELEAECAILQYAVEHHPVTVSDVRRRFSDTLKTARVRAGRVLEALHERGYLKRRPQGDTVRYVPGLPETALLRKFVRDFGERSLGGSIGLGDEELARLNRIVRRFGGRDERSGSR